MKLGLNVYSQLHRIRRLSGNGNYGAILNGIGLQKKNRKLLFRLDPNKSFERNESVSDVVIRKAKTDDCEVIVSFIRMMIKEMSDMGGHPENQDEYFWKSFIDTVLPAIENSDRLYLVAENNDGPVGFFEGRVDMLYQVFEPKKCFHINSVYVIPEKRNKVSGHGVGTARIKSKQDQESIFGNRF